VATEKTTGKPPKKVIIDEDFGDFEPQTTAELTQQREKGFKSRRGAKPLGIKPRGAKRVLSDAKITTNRPTNIYKDWVVDDDGEAGWCIWWTTEKSEYHGKEEIVKFNPRTEEELTLGYDYTIPFTVEKAKKLIEASFGGTKFYRKDGETTYEVSRTDLEALFLADVKVGLTPTPKAK